MKILLIRHGETDLNVSGLVHKIGDPAGLNEKGRRQSQAIAKACQKAGVETLYTSPEKRAQETVEIIGSTLKLNSIVIEAFRERNFGDWSGKPWAEIEPVLEKMTFQERYTFNPPGGESWQEFEKILKAALDQIVQEKHKIVAVVTHMADIRILLPILKNEPRETSFTYKFANGSITTVQYTDGKFKVLSENDTSHLKF